MWHTNPTPKEFIVYSFQGKNQHAITLTCSNFDTKGRDFKWYTSPPTEMWNGDTDRLSISALRITAPYVQVAFPTKLST